MSDPFKDQTPEQILKDMNNLVEHICDQTKKPQLPHDGHNIIANGQLYRFNRKTKEYQPIEMNDEKP